MDRLADTDIWTDIQTDGWTDGSSEGVNRWVDDWKDIFYWIGRQTDGQMERRIICIER